MVIRFASIWSTLAAVRPHVAMALVAALAACGGGNNNSEGDTQPPTLQISAPALHASVATPNVRVQGQAADNASVTALSYQLNGAAAVSVPVTAGTTLNFDFTIAGLTTGANSIALVASDAANNRTTATLSLSYVPPPIAPTVSITASPAAVSSGGATALSWSSTNATSCTASGAWSGVKATSGTQASAALSATSTFTLTCSGAGGSASNSATVTVSTSPPAPTVSLSANPSTVASGGISTLSWSSTNATSCTASGAWSGSKGTSGTQGTGALSATSSFTLTCSGAGGSGGASATVTVSGSTGALNFQRVVIDTSSPSDPWMKAMADLDGDGLPDLIVSGAAGPVVWYQAPNWTKRTISASANSESGSAVGDINGDGLIDVVVGKTWYQNVGGGASWIARNLPSGSAGTHDVVVADINGDGKADIIMRGENTTVVTVYMQVSPTSWTVFDVQPDIGLNGLNVADVDGDGFPDIVVGGVWMQNPGTNFATATWIQHTFTTGWNSFAAVKVIDIDRDGRPDIVLSVSEDVGKLSWFKAPADPRTGTWTENMVATGLDHVHGVAVYDIDKDGFLDIVASEYGPTGAGRLIVYRGNGGASWTATELGRDHLHNVSVGDVDGDGDIDLFGVDAFGVNPVILYRNVGNGAANRVLVFSKTLGFRHDSIPAGIAAIQQLGATNGFAVDATEDSSVFTSTNLARYKALVFLNPSGDILNTAQRAAFQLYIQNGGGFVGIHNPNALTLDGWAWYTKLVCARYASEVPSQPSRLNIVNTTHISTQGLPNPWTISMESYNWDVNPKVNGCTVLINLDETSVSGGTMGSDHPFSWYHAYDGGRIWYTVGGADSANYSDSNFLNHLLGGIRYAGAF